VCGVPIITSIVSNGCGDGSKRVGKGSDGEGYLARCAGSEAIHSIGHQTFRRTGAQHRAGFVYGLREYAESVMERPFGLVEDVLRSSAQDDGTSLTQSHTRETNRL